MGWSDVALNLRGPVVQDLQKHFTQRWNFIYDEKYSLKSTRYLRLPDMASGPQQGGEYPPPQQREFEEGAEGSRGFGGDGEEGERGFGGHEGGFRRKMYNRFNEEYQEHYGGGHHQQQQQYQSHGEHGSQRASIDAQITRSSSKWSHNISTEVSWCCELPLKLPTDSTSARSRTRTSRPSGTVNTLSTSRTSSSLQPLETSSVPSRTRLAQQSLSALYVLLAMARSTR